MGDKPTKPAVSDRNKTAPVGFLGLLHWGETVYIFEKGRTPNAIHISNDKTRYQVTRQERGIYLKGGALVRASARLHRTWENK